jgi:hypothetical protein
LKNSLAPPPFAVHLGQFGPSTHKEDGTEQGVMYAQDPESSGLTPLAINGRLFRGCKPRRTFAGAGSSIWCWERVTDTLRSGGYQWLLPTC